MNDTSKCYCELLDEIEWDTDFTVLAGDDTDATQFMYGYVPTATFVLSLAVEIGERIARQAVDAQLERRLVTYDGDRSDGRYLQPADASDPEAFDATVWWRRRKDDVVPSQRYREPEPQSNRFAQLRRNMATAAASTAA